jgi:hypothetical protein
MTRSSLAACQACRRAVPAAARFCPSCGVTIAPIEMIALVGDDTVGDEREVVLGRRVRSGQSSRLSLLVGGAAAVLLVVAAAVIARSRPDVAASSTTYPGTSLAPTLTFAPTSAAPPSSALPTTTTSLPSRTRASDGPLLGEQSGMEVWFHASFVDATPGGVFRVDVDRGIVEHVAGVQETNDFVFGLSTVEAGGFSYQRNTDWVTVHRDGTTSTAARSLLGGIVDVDSSGVWLQPFQPDGKTPSNRLDLRRPDGSITAFRLPGESFAPQPAGNGRFVVRTPDDRQFLFDTASGSVTPMIGAVRVASASGAYVSVECSDRLVCDSVYEGTDGVARPLPLNPQGSIALSPDGAWIVRSEPTYSTVSSILSVLNPVTGELVDLGLVPADAFGSLGAWSAEGRWLVAPTVAGLAFWRPGLTSALVLPISNGRLLVDTLAIGRAV